MLSEPASDPGTLRAGIGTATITPPLPVFLAGFGGRDEPATEVHTDLEARVLFLADDRSVGLCLVVCDLLGMSPGWANALRGAVAQALGLPLGAVLTACTHTHSGPSAIAGTAALGWPTPDGYRERLVASCIDAARAARATAVPAELHVTRAPLPGGLSFNRRDLPYVPTFAALDVRGTDGSGRIGVLANVAIHPVALGPGCLAVSPDWVGTFRPALEAEVGGRAVLLSGPLGDVNPAGSIHRELQPTAHDDPGMWGSFELAATVGTGVAEAVAAVLPGAEPTPGRLAVLAERTLELAAGDTTLGAAAGGHPVRVDLVEWALGGTRLVSVPGEAFTAFGDAVLAARPGPTLLAGLAPAWLGYLPEPFTEGYEESMSYGAPFVARLLAELTRSPPSASSGPSGSGW